MAVSVAGHRRRRIICIGRRREIRLRGVVKSGKNIFNIAGGKDKDEETVNRR